MSNDGNEGQKTGVTAEAFGFTEASGSADYADKNVEIARSFFAKSSVPGPSIFAIPAWTDTLVT
jgi:hypothetical protein